MLSLNHDNIDFYLPGNYYQTLTKCNSEQFLNNLDNKFSCHLKVILNHNNYKYYPDIFTRVDMIDSNKGKFLIYRMVYCDNDENIIKKINDTFISQDKKANWYYHHWSIFDIDFESFLILRHEMGIMQKVKIIHSRYWSTSQYNLQYNYENTELSFEKNTEISLLSHNLYENYYNIIRSYNIYKVLDKKRLKRFLEDRADLLLLYELK